MADEAVIIELIEGGIPIRFDIVNADIPKGTLLKIVDPKKAAKTAADNDPFAGIAAEEIVSGDGATTIVAWTKGIFDLTSGAGVTAGEKVSIKATNRYAKIDATDDLFSNIGVALETSIGAAEIDAVFVGWGS